MIITPVEGQRVRWMRTEGGGGGGSHRPNEKTPIEAVVVRRGRRGKDLIQLVDESLPVWLRKKWVFRENLEPLVTATLTQDVLDVLNA